MNEGFQIGNKISAEIRDNQMRYIQRLKQSAENTTEKHSFTGFDPTDDTSFIDLEDIQTDRRISSVDMDEFIDQSDRLIQKNLAENAEGLGLNKGDYIGDGDFYKEQLKVLNNELSAWKKHLNVDNVELNLNTASNATDRASLSIDITAGTRVHSIAVPFNMATHSTLGGDLRLGIAGGMVDTTGIEDIKMRVSKKQLDMKNSSMMPYREASLLSIIKTLRHKESTSGATAGESVDAFKSLLKSRLSEFYDFAGRNVDTASGRIKPILDYSSINDIKNKALEPISFNNMNANGRTVLDPDAQINRAMLGLQDASDGWYNFLGGITEEDQLKYGPDIITTEKGKYVLTPHMKNDTSVAVRRDFAAMKLQQTLQKGNARQMDSLYQGPDYDYSSSRQLVRTIPFNADGAGIRKMSEAGVGISHGVVDPFKYDALINKDSKKVSSYVVKNIAVVAAYPLEFLRDIYGTGKGGSFSSTGSYKVTDFAETVADKYQRWAAEKEIDGTKAYKSSDEILRSAGIPTTELQAGNTYVLNKNVNQDALTKAYTHVHNFKSREEDGLVFRKADDIAPDQAVKKGQIIGAMYRGDVKVESIPALFDGKINYNKVGGASKVSITISEGLYGGVVVGKTKVTPSRSESSGLNELFTNKDIMEYGGKTEGKEAFGVHNAVDRKETQTMKNLHGIAIDSEYGALVYTVEEDLRAREVAIAGGSRVKVKGPHTSTQLDVHGQLKLIDDVFHHQQFDVSFYDVSNNIVNRYLKSNGLSYTKDHALKNARNLDILGGKLEQMVADGDMNFTGFTMADMSLGRGPRKPTVLMMDKMMNQIIREAGGTSEDVFNVRSNIFNHYISKMQGKTIDGTKFSAGQMQTKATDLIEDLFQLEFKNDVNVFADSVKPTSLLKNSFRYATTDMARLLLDPISGKAHYDYRYKKIIAGNKHSQILKGAMMTASNGLIASQSSLLSGLKSAGLMHDAYLKSGSKNVVEAISSLSDLYDPSQMYKSGSASFDKTFREIGETLGLDLGTKSSSSISLGLKLDYEGNAKVIEALARMRSNLNPDERVIAQNFIDKGVSIPSNELLGKSNMDINFSGNFLEQRSNMVNSFKDLYAAVASGGDNATIERALQNMIGNTADVAVQVGEEMATGDLLRNALSGEFEGIHGLAVSDTKDHLAGSKALGSGRVLNDADLDELATVFVEESEFKSLFGKNYDPKDITYAMAHRDPGLSQSMDTVVRVKVGQRLISGQISLHPTLADLKKMDFDNDPFGLLRIDSNGDLAKLGFQRTKKLLKIQADYTRNIKPELDLISKSADAAEKRADLEMFNTAKANRRKDPEAYREVIRVLKEKKKTDWVGKYKSSVTEQMEIGKLSNSIGEVSAMVFSRLDELDAFSGELDITNKRLASLTSSMAFISEGAIRMAKTGAGSTARAASSFSETLQILMGDNRSDLFSKRSPADLADEMTRNVLELFGQKVNKSELKGLTGATVLNKHMNELDGSYILEFGKKATVSEDFLFLAQKLDDGLYKLDASEIKKSMLDIINLSDKASSSDNVNFSRRVFKMLAKKGTEAKEILGVINRVSTNEKLKGSSILLNDDALGAALGLDTENRPTYNEELRGVETASPMAKEKVRKAEEAAAELRNIVTEEAEKRKAPATPDMPDVGSMAKRMDFGKGVMAGLVAFAAGASMGGMFGGGELEAPMPPAIPMSSEMGPASVGTIASAPAYLMDKSTISNRMNIRDAGSPAQFLGRANMANANANVSIHDKSLNDAQYLSEYQNRTSGRF